MGPLPGSSWRNADHYLDLRRRIISGELFDTVLVPATLSEAYGVSRTPLRESLNRLTVEGLLEQVSRGYVVRTILADEVLDICEARMGLEGTAARCAAERRTELDLAKLTRIQEESAPGNQDHVRHLADVSFHQALRQAAHNQTIVGVMDRLDALLAIHDSRVGPDSHNLEMIWQEHQRILDSVRERDADRAQMEMLAHQIRTRDLRLRQLAGIN